MNLRSTPVAKRMDRDSAVADKEGWVFSLIQVLILALACPAASADHRLMIVGAVSKGYVVGMKLPPSGLFALTPAITWEHLSYTHPSITAIDYDRHDPNILYLAAGNGCIRSTDRGRTWRILTSWDMTELLDVAVDPHHPGTLFVALPDGIGRSTDEGRTWQRTQDGLRGKYTKTIRVDRTHPNHLVAGTVDGIFRSADNGSHWTPAAANAARISHLEQSPHRPQEWLAATETGALLRSADNGGTWKTLLQNGSTIYHVSYDPADPHRIALATWAPGVLVSDDGGKSFTPRNQGLPSDHIWSVAFDPDHPGRLYASVHEEAVFVSHDAGRHWQKHGLEGSIVNAMYFLPETAPSPHATRVRQVIEASAGNPKGSYQTIAANLYLHRDLAWSSRRLLELLSDPSGDMFWMFPVTAIAYLDRGQLTTEARTALRASWKTYMPYRGDTENHWLLYYTTLYLMSQLYPNEPGETWFTGKSSKENLHEAESYLLHWMKLTTTIGQGEYDCTHYIGVFLLPLSYLAEWSTDEKMRLRARRMLDWLIADFAVDSLNGIYTGAHARTDDVQVLEKWRGVSSDLGWLLFGVGYPLPGYSYYGFFYAVASGYEPPSIIRQIATDRSQPYLHREQKRTRHRWRFSDLRNSPVYKTTYMHHDYAVGSDQGGILQPIQQHSWDVTWALPDPRGKRNTIFSLHPYSSVQELQMYFTLMPDNGTEAVVRSKKSYDSPDKFLGGSPYEQILQDQDTVIALYNIPPGTRFPHINGFFPDDLTRFEEHPSGWIFAQGGNAYIAYRPLAPYEWKPVEGGGRRLYSPHLRNGTILQAASASEFASFEAFQNSILALPLKVTMEPVPSVQFRTLRGAYLHFTYGQPRDFSKWKLFNGPYLQSDNGSRRLLVTHRAERYEIDLSSLLP